MRNRLWIIVELLLLTAVVPRSGAQEDAVAPGAAILARLPTADAFGPGWTEAGEPIRIVPADVFRDGARLAYGGPAGARVVLTVLLVTDERVAVRAAWEAATKLYDAYRHDLVADEEFTASLAAMEPPPGCAEAKRVEGTNEQDTFVTGATLCAADPDLILLAVASGTVGGDVGYRAADAVLAAALEGAPVNAEITATAAPP